MVLHYLITRYNIRIPEWYSRDKNRQYILTEKWMQHRWELFNEYTLPSVTKQTCQDFVWIVLLDDFTPIKWVIKLNLCSKLYILRTDSDWLETLTRTFKNNRSNYIATTRLDNDDAIHPEFIATIQKHLEPTKMFLNIPNGWKLNSQTGKRIKMRHPANHFTTYIEPSDEAKTVYHVPHGRAMEKVAPIKQIETSKRLWTQVIHERNYIND